VILALLAALSIWLSAGTLAVTGGDTQRIAALPSTWILGALAIAAFAAARAAKLRNADAWPLAISLLLWLPFLPGPVPAVFLLWQGPVEAIVWVIVGAGMIAVRAPVAPKLFTDPKSAPAIAGVMLAIVALIAFSQVRGVIPGGDEPHYLAATQSVLHDGDLRVANNYASGQYLDYFAGRLEPHFLKRSTSGEIYSIHAPGVSFIVLPAFAIAGYTGAIFTMIVIAALTAYVAWRIAFRVSGNAAAAWVGVIAVFGTTPYFFHTFTIYPEIIGAFIVSMTVWLLLDLSEGRGAGHRMLFAVGSALAVLPWLHTRFAVLAGLFGSIVLLRIVRSGGVSRIVAFLAMPAIAGIAWFAFFWVIWGSPSPTAPYGADTSTSTSYILRGLIGLLVDQQFGVVATAPIYVMAFAGVFELYKRQPRLTIELSLVVIAYAITVASYQMWWAGSAAPARFLVSILPLAVLPVAVASTRSWKMVTVLLLLVSVSLMAPRVLVEGGRFIFNNRAPLDATLEWLSQIVDLPLALPSVHRDGGSIAIRDGAVWLAMIAAAIGLASAGRRSVAACWTGGALALAIASMLAITVGWNFRGAVPLTADRSKLAALAAYRPQWQSPNFLERVALQLPATVRLNRVPAGEYEIAPAEGAAVSVGRNDAPIERSSGGSLRLRLPVAAQTLNLRADHPFTLRPIALTPPAATRHAIRAARYGPARAFFFDEWAYLEPDGFWTRANGLAEVVIDADQSVHATGLPISITAGAVETTVEVSTGSWREALSLSAGERRDVVLPPGASAWPLRIRSGAGFRPSERDPGSRDVRMLAAWIAIH
jgi:hypothetical protein